MDEKKLSNALTDEQQATMQEGELTDEALDAVAGGKGDEFKKNGYVLK